jgi:hypothetical protein
MEPVQSDNFTKTVTTVSWSDLEAQFSASGRSSEGDGFMNAYLIRMILSGSPQDIKDAVLKAKQKVEETFGLSWIGFDEEKTPLEIAEYFSSIKG